MFLQGLAIDDNVIKINNHEAINERREYLVHAGAKCGRCICQAKGHDKELLRTIMCHTCRLWLIPFSYASLIVPTPQTELCKVPCISKLTKQVIDVRDGILVLNSDHVKGPFLRDSRRRNQLYLLLSR